MRQRWPREQFRSPPRSKRSSSRRSSSSRFSLCESRSSRRSSSCVKPWKPSSSTGRWTPKLLSPGWQKSECPCWSKKNAWLSHPFVMVCTQERRGAETQAGYSPKSWWGWNESGSAEKAGREPARTRKTEAKSNHEGPGQKQASSFQGHKYWHNRPSMKAKGKDVVCQYLGQSSWLVSVLFARNTWARNPGKKWRRSWSATSRNLKNINCLILNLVKMRPEKISNHFQMIS